MTFLQNILPSTVSRNRFFVGWTFALVLIATAYSVQQFIPSLGVHPYDFYFYDPLQLGVAAAIIFGTRRNSPAHVSGWWLIASSCILNAVVNGGFYFVLYKIFGVTNYVNVVYAVMMTAQSLAVIGLFILSRERNGRKDYSSLIDAFIMSVGVGLILWIFILIPSASAVDLGTLMKIWDIYYPVMELAMFWLAVRMVFQKTNRPLSLHLLVWATLIYVIDDSIVTILDFHIEMSVNTYGLTRAVIALGLVLFGIAAVHPSVTQLTADSQGTRTPGIRRLILLAASSLLAPAVLVQQYFSHNTSQIPVIASASALLFLLVVIRMIGMLRVQVETNAQLDESVKKLHKADQDLRHAQKLEAVGKLASGIAHEINTPMQFIGDNLRFLGTSFSTVDQFVTATREFQTSGNPKQENVDFEELEFLSEEIPRAIHDTLDGVERVTTIVRAMKAFGSPSSLSEANMVKVDEVITNTLAVAGSELHDVDVELDLDESAQIIGFVGDLNQVFLNLIMNATQSISDTQQRGRISISSRVENDEVVIGITDTGAGIPSAIQDRIFEPFFTTKPVGSGTGQGLSLVWALVVERHHGSVGFTSREGVGTTFTVRLPIAGPMGQDASAESEPLAVMA